MAKEVFPSDRISLRVSQALADVVKQLRITGEIGIVMTLRDKTSRALLQTSSIGTISDSVMFQLSVAQAAEVTGRLSEKHLTDDHVLSRQDGIVGRIKPGAAIVADRYVLGVSHLPELVGETICLIAAVRLGWLSKDQAKQMAEIQDEKHPNGNRIYLCSEWALSAATRELMSKMPENPAERIKWFYITARYELSNEEFGACFETYILPLVKPPTQSDKDFYTALETLGVKPIPANPEERQVTMEILASPEFQKLLSDVTNQ